ncbi:putative inactive histone-lysine N-methyltransferase SUVR2 isoform X1 [Canna indica]|uniref:Inactive histone-lysine N-methyltransferase SUVR2 isoform X1 n=1 Tax=Canna indica TaxID=4628 RepID=A0AAQ3K0W8_9LILI|nr:putative inactive histone-lysine N-methyltransferase SUVR2 isoform X1 [Canna indica]
MAPIPAKALAALNAMKAIGIPMQTAKPVLKNLLKVYDNNWEYIEAENYRVLADAILDMQESQAMEKQKKISDDDISWKGKEVVTDEPEPLRTRARTRKENQHLASSQASYDVAGEPLQKKILDDNISRKGKEVVTDEPEPLRARVRARKEHHHLSPSNVGFDATNEPSLKKPKLENDALPDSHYEQESEGLVYSRNRRGKIVISMLPQPLFGEPAPRNLSPQPSSGQSVPEAVLPQTSNTSQKSGQALAHMYNRETRTLDQADEVCPVPAKTNKLVISQKDKQPVQEKIGNPILLKKPKDEPDTDYLQKHDTVSCSSDAASPTEEQCSYDSSISEIPLRMISPLQPLSTGNIDPQSQASHHHSMDTSATLQQDVNGSVGRDGQTKNDNGRLPVDKCQKGTTSKILSVQESSSFNVDVASSELGEVKLSFSCSSDQPDFHVPNLETVFKLVEDRCLRSYRILQPSFSLTNLMKEMCQCFLELGSDTADDRQENVVQIIPTLDSLKKPIMPGVYDVMPPNNSLHLTTHDDSRALDKSDPSCAHNIGGNDQNGRSMEMEKTELPESAKSESLSLVVVQQPQNPLGELRPLHDVIDISKGEERVKIPVINEITSDKYPPSFNYIPRNIVYQNAFVNFSLARIGDEDCCADCFNDCLAAPLPCACARETGGEFAYTLDGLVRKEFLDECISMYHEPQKHHKFHCEDCPLERSKSEGPPEACKGHLLRKFIKECWSKCGCSMHCGNRVVQRGITRNLQVYLTSKEKGWGLRTSEKLPRGAFVCEYVGEILTNTELYDRTMQTTGNAKHTYPVLLDADWGAEGSLKDEEALCLDATFYGNVARFINHRCSDANMIEIPVEVETPDHHYYHLAFFTTRKVEPFEELTWDYGIDFDDHDHPIKAFKCRCGSRLCRDIKRHSQSQHDTSLGLV